MDKNKTQALLAMALLTILIGNTVTALTIHPGVHFYGGRLDVTFQDSTTFSYLATGDQFVVLDGMNLSVSNINSIMGINISNLDSDMTNRASETTVLQFNATYSGSTARFTFTGNHTNARYNVYVDDVAQTHTDTANQIIFTISSWSDHDIEIELDGYVPDPPYNGGSTYFPSTNYDNLTWSRGNYSDREVIIGNDDEYPSSPTDGTVWQNGTDQWYNFSVNETQFFTAWSYNDTTHTYSEVGLNLEWGVLGLNVFNESNPSQALTFDIEISDKDGDETYTESGLTNTEYINLSDIPFGDDTVFVIESTGYKLRTYYKDLAVNHFYNYSFYLAPEGGEGGGPVVDPDDENTTKLYFVQVIDESSQPISDAKVIVSRYINVTDSYEEIGSMLTGGYGYASIYLIPNTLYKVTASHDDYISKTEDWITDSTYYGSAYPKIIQLQATAPDYENETSFNDIIIFEGDLTGSTLRVNFSDSSGETIDTSIAVYMINTSNEDVTFLEWDNRTGIQSFSFTIDNVDIYNCYNVILYLNHETLDNVTNSIMVCGEERRNTSITDETRFNTLFDANYGSNPFGWSNTIGFFIMLAGFFSFGQRNAGVSLIVTGGVLIFINSVIGLSFIGVTIPIVFIAFGILVMWRNHRKEEHR